MLRILANLIIMAAEIAAIAAVAWSGFTAPFLFAGATALLALALGVHLEYARLAHEVPFYFGEGGRLRRFTTPLVATGEAVFKSVLAGIAALLTFAGTDKPRVLLIAILFGATLYAGTNVLRWLSLDFGARPSRWGYFRLAAPLGVLFSAGGLVLGEFGWIKAPALRELGTRILFEMPARPSIAQASELLFSIRLYFDTIVAGLLGAVMPPAAAKIAGVLISTNVLAGFVIAIYAVVIAEAVRRLERAWL